MTMHLVAVSFFISNLLLSGSHCGNTSGKSSLILRLSFGYASIVPGWEKGANKLVGRSARLLEKWFLAQKLGYKAWFVQSEKYYYTQHDGYYNNIRALGLEYPTPDYSKALPFLLMLPKSVILPINASNFFSYPDTTWSIFKEVRHL